MKSKKKAEVDEQHKVLKTRFGVGIKSAPADPKNEAKKRRSGDYNDPNKKGTKIQPKKVSAQKPIRGAGLQMEVDNNDMMMMMHNVSLI